MKTMRKLIFVIALSFLFTGCITSKKSSLLNSIEIGMNKQQVVAILGDNYLSSVNGNVTYMKYILKDDKFGNTSAYYVRLIDGKVQSFGQVGDFNSTKDPTINVNLNKK